MLYIVYDYIFFVLLVNVYVYEMSKFVYFYIGEV